MANAKQSSTARLFASVREAQTPNLRLEDSGERARAKARLLQVIDRADALDRPAAQAKPVKLGWRFGLGTLAAAACTFAVLFALPTGNNSGEGLGFEVDGIEFAANQMIHADGEAKHLAFSDDTVVELSPGSSMHIAELRSTGANVVLSQGEISLAVHHEHDTSWQVHAGPWTVHVTGTQFAVNWKPTAEYFRVAVTEGSVRVEGPEGELAKLRAGESLVRERGKATLEPETLDIAAAEKPTRPEQPLASLEQPALDEALPAPLEIVPDDLPSAVKPRLEPELEPATPSWTEQFDNSEYQLAWQTLSGLPGGVHGLAKDANAPTLLDLADLARFSKHDGDARKVLERLRKTYPDSSEAAQAAFTLGLLTSAKGSQAKAASYFEQYLSERPSGSLAGDALGRLMDCYDALGRNAEARASAQKYLAQHPSGPHASKAQTILAQ